MTKRTQEKIITAICAVMMAFTYFAAGFSVCVGLPQVTEQMARMTSADNISPFSKQELVQLAVATRDYAVSDNDRSALMAAVGEANRAEDTPYADATPEELLHASPEYTLTEEALAHLDDVYDLFSCLTMPIIGTALIAGFCLMATLRMFGSRVVGRELLWAGVIPLAAFLVFGIWAAFGFSGLFSFVHSLFFSAGSWTFPYDSLLICMYPLAFWEGMGAVWLISSCTLSVVSIVIGALLSRRKRPRAQAAGER